MGWCTRSSDIDDHAMLDQDCPTRAGRGHSFRRHHCARGLLVSCPRLPWGNRGCDWANSSPAAHPFPMPRPSSPSTIKIEADTDLLTEHPMRPAGPESPLRRTVRVVSFRSAASNPSHETVQDESLRSSGIWKLGSGLPTSSKTILPSFSGRVGRFASTISDLTS